MENNKFFQSKVLTLIVCIIAALIIILIVFKVGMFVGERKAEFTFRWGDNYHRNFGGPRGGFMQGFNDRDFIDANGTFGQIIKIDNSNIVVKGRDDIEKVIIINDKTVIKSLNETIKSSDLKVDDYIVTIGEPNEQGQITAKLIRVMPTPPPLPPVNLPQK
jgi:hypothetical protein